MVDDIMDEIQNLSNKELFKILKDLGHKTGPVTSTTRSVYERKLYRIRTSTVGVGDQSSILSTNENAYEVDDSLDRMSSTHGSGDFVVSTRTFVEDSLIEDEENDEDVAGMHNSDDEEDKRKVEEDRVDSIVTMRKKVNAKKAEVWPVDDDDDDTQDYVVKKSQVETKQLLGHDKISKQEDEKDADYYIKKYSADYSHEKERMMLDSVELRRRPLHSVRETSNLLTSPFSSNVDSMFTSRSAPPPSYSSVTGGPPYTSLNDYHSTVNHINVKSQHQMNGQRPTQAVVNQQVSTGPVGKIMLIIALFVAFFIILVLIFIESAQELPSIKA